MQVFTLNTWLLPFNISKDNEKRLDSIIAYLKSNEIDIILLQEVWLNYYVTVLSRELSSSYNIYTSNKSRFFNQSGLVTLIKKDINVTSYEHISFEFQIGSNLEERVGKKGFQYFKLRSSTTEFGLVNLHLYASQTKIDRQLSQLKSILINRELTNLILGGDFNLAWNDIVSAYDFFKQPKQDGNTVSKKNSYQNKGFNRKNTNESKIDHILISKDSSLEVINEEVLEDDFSDHYGILATVSNFNNSY